jgi:hypothetical protein
LLAHRDWIRDLNATNVKTTVQAVKSRVVNPIPPPSTVTICRLGGRCKGCGRSQHREGPRIDEFWSSTRRESPDRYRLLIEKE